MNKQIAKQVLLSNVNACYNAVKENGWQSEMLKENIDNIVDAIEPDHPKVKLPREVGEELEDWLKTDNIDDILENLVCIYDIDHDAVRDWWESTLGATYLIADMARYGLEAEPEAKWYVQTPKEWWDDPDVQEWMHLDKSCGVRSGFNNSSRTAFTRYELKHYHLDSDIFTLVPVEADEEVSR